jgi:hypothetical protein
MGRHGEEVNPIAIEPAAISATPADEADLDII